MERAGRLIGRLKPARKALTTEELLLAAWPAAVGRRLAGKTRAVKLVRECLIVEVEDALWQRNLHGLRDQILKNVRGLVDGTPLEDIEFRVGVPRRPPQWELLPSGAGLMASRGSGLDEADGIADPVFRRIYVNSRRKAGA